MTAGDVTKALGLPAVSQIGIMVRDLERPIQFLESVAGIGPFDVRIMEGDVWDRGEEKHIKARLAFAMSGSVQIELIHVLEGDSFHLEFLREHGEGIHHLGFMVSDFEARLRQAKEMGFPVLQTGTGGRFYAYLDTRPLCGTIVELIEEFPQSPA